MLFFFACLGWSAGLFAADKLIGFHSARTMSQAMPWICEEAGLFRKYDFDFQLVYISSAPIVTAAILGGDAQVAISGGEAIIRAYAQGATDLVFIGSAKNTLTHSILAKPEIKRPEDLRGKKLGLSRLGSNSHYFIIQALRKSGVDRMKSIFIQTGGQVENLAALLSGNVDAATMTGPSGGTTGRRAGFSLRGLRPGSAYSVRRGDADHAPLAHEFARAGDREILPRHCRSDEDFISR